MLCNQHCKIVTPIAPKPYDSANPKEWPADLNAPEKKAKRPLLNLASDGRPLDPRQPSPLLGIYAVI